MRVFVLKIFIIVVLFMSVGGVFAQTGKEKRQEKKRMEQLRTDSLITGGVYVFSAQQSSSNHFKNVDLSGQGAFLKISNDSVNAFLPYFGRVFNVAYNSDGGIRLETVADGYKLEKNEKKFSYTVTFKVTDKNDNYDFKLIISRSGWGNLILNSDKRETISYYGFLKSARE